MATGTSLPCQLLLIHLRLFHFWPVEAPIFHYQLPNATHGNWDLSALSASALDWMHPIQSALSAPLLIPDKTRSPRLGCTLTQNSFGLTLVPQVILKPNSFCNFDSDQDHLSFYNFPQNEFENLNQLSTSFTTFGGRSGWIVVEIISSCYKLQSLKHGGRHAEGLLTNRGGFSSAGS